MKAASAQVRFHAAVQELGEAIDMGVTSVREVPARSTVIRELLPISSSRVA